MSIEETFQATVRAATYTLFRSVWACFKGSFGGFVLYWCMSAANSSSRSSCNSRCVTVDASKSCGEKRVLNYASHGHAFDQSGKRGGDQRHVPDALLLRGMQTAFFDRPCRLLRRGRRFPPMIRNVSACPATRLNVRDVGRLRFSVRCRVSSRVKSD